MTTPNKTAIETRKAPLDIALVMKLSPNMSESAPVAGPDTCQMGTKRGNANAQRKTAAERNGDR
ncbi:hypothetical protein [uncultured Roseibium sp.]|uniref:hypothetical protein n=1 Tax=uncultured Roseibium sp. TaxID=1936171 RepID=UPI00374DA6F8